MIAFKIDWKAILESNGELKRSTLKFTDQEYSEITQEQLEERVHQLIMTELMDMINLHIENINEIEIK